MIMLTFNVFIFLITLCVAKSEMDYETMCKNDFRDEKNNAIDVLQYCSDKLCIEKCCGPDKILLYGSKCINMTGFHRLTKKYPYLEYQYNSTNILSYFNVTETAKKKVVFVQNQRNSIYLDNCTAAHAVKGIYVISKNGSLQVQETNGSISTVERLHYCIDKNVVKIQKKPKVLMVTTIVREITIDETTMKNINTFENISIMISSFFLLLVLIVYCLLPDLRNLTGLVLMAYSWTLLGAFIMTLISRYIIDLLKPEHPENICKIFSPLVYFGFVSSIFWLSVYSFDVWWGLRGFRIKRNSKQGKLVKFLWYALYAWGTPFMLTTIIAVLDNISDLNLAVPTPFTSCLKNGRPLDIYYKIPIGILIFINIVLFCMTVYNIWLVKRALNKYQESAKSKQQSNKFATYAKLFLMMGVSWCMELFPLEKQLWTYILSNLYNLLTGVNLFYMFVCKKIILLQLCKKFNIRNNYIKILELELNQNGTQSGITKSSDLSSTIRRRSKDQAQDIDHNYPKEETTLV